MEAIKYPEQEGLHWGRLKLGKWQKWLSRLGINRLGQKSSRVVKKASFFDSGPEKSEMRGSSRVTGLMEPRPDRAWVAHAGKAWEGVQVVGCAADRSNKEKLQEWILLV